MNVLIVTHSRDNESVEMVAEAVAARGGRAIRLDTDLFPTRVRLSLAQGGARTGGLLRTPEAEIALDEIDAIWYRRAAIADALPQELDAQQRRAAVGESRRVLFGFLDGCGIYALGSKASILAAENKVLQLELARESGLRVPKTLVSNDPERVRAFAAECTGGLITKMMHSFAIYDEDGQENVVFTSPVSEEDLQDLDGLSLCPMTFQEAIPKARELRVTVVGERVFTASLSAHLGGPGQGDWRVVGVETETSWTVSELPREVERGLLRVMDRLGLDYGAADFIVRPDGEHVFLEVNPAGEFFWLQRAPGLPIAEAMADVLLGRAARRARPPFRR